MAKLQSGGTGHGHHVATPLKEINLETLYYGISHVSSSLKSLWVTSLKFSYCSLKFTFPTTFSVSIDFHLC